MSENTNSDTNTQYNKKKKRLTKVVFYIMAVLLSITTGLTIYMSVNMYKYTTKTDSAKDNTEDKPASSDTDVKEGYTLIKDEVLAELKDESYYMGRDNLLSSIRAMMEEGDSTLKMLRTLYPNQLVYNEPDGFIFKDINKNLTMHKYDSKNFKIEVDDNDIPTKVEYYENDNLVSYKGIDVSKHNGTIDWKKVKADGVDFAILRAVVRGYGSEGNLLPDDSFSKNAKEATANGIAIGAYVFSEAITKEEAIEEADLILEMIKPYEVKYPVVIDIEDIFNDDGRNEALSPSELTDIVLTFCNKIKDAGYTPMIYCNLKGFIGMLEFERLEGIEKWYAYYGDELYFPYDVSMWQFTSSGEVNGVTGKVDLNISFKNYNK